MNTLYHTNIFASLYHTYKCTHTYKFTHPLPYLMVTHTQLKTLPHTVADFTIPHHLPYLMNIATSCDTLPYIHLTTPLGPGHLLPHLITMVISTIYTGYLLPTHPYQRWGKHKSACAYKHFIEVLEGALNHLSQHKHLYLCLKHFQCWCLIST